MTKRILIAIAWGLAGLLFAVGLTAGAFTLAGREISEPATPSLFSSSPTPSRQERGSPGPDDGGSPSSRPARDDDVSGNCDEAEHANDPECRSGFAGDDSSGPGSVEDSGSGSDDSGSGSDGSGSGSDDSGSGSDDSGSGSDDRDDD